MGTSITFDPQFRDWMRSRVKVENQNALSTDAYAQRTYGTSFYVMARLEQSTKIVKDTKGREVASDMRLYCAPEDADTGAEIVINTTDRLTFPGGYVNSSIINVQKHNGEDGKTMHYEVAL